MAVLAAASRTCIRARYSIPPGSRRTGRGRAPLTRRLSYAALCTRVKTNIQPNLFAPIFHWVRVPRKSVISNLNVCFSGQLMDQMYFYSALHCTALHCTAHHSVSAQGTISNQHCIVGSTQSINDGTRNKVNMARKPLMEDSYVQVGAGGKDLNCLVACSCQCCSSERKGRQDYVRGGEMYERNTASDKTSHNNIVHFVQICIIKILGKPQILQLVATALLALFPKVKHKPQK
jgi:hypothetical protein